MRDLALDTHNLEKFLHDLSTGFSPPLSETLDLATYADKLLKNAVIFSASIEGEVVALAAIYCNNLKTRHAYCPFIGVKSEFRRTGLANTLMQSALAYLRAIAFNGLSLEVYKNNLPALRFYERSGFSIAEETKSSYILRVAL